MPAAKKAEAQRVELRFSGSGGQGIMLAATVYAEAAVEGGFEVVATQSYGPEARGGASKAEVIVSSQGHEIDFPEVTDPDVTLCLSQEAFDAYAVQTRRGGIVIYDDKLVEPTAVGGRRLVGAPLTATAETELGKAIVANIVALGLMQREAGVVTIKALETALTRRLPARLLDLNLRALRCGAELDPRAGAARRRADAAPPRVSRRS